MLTETGQRSRPALPDADFDRQKITFLAILKPSGDFYFFSDRQTISGEFLAILSLVWLEKFSKRSPDDILRISGDFEPDLARRDRIIHPVFFSFVRAFVRY